MTLRLLVTRDLWRSLKGDTFSTTLAILSIAIGVAAAAVTLSIVRGTLLRPLPYYEAERIVELYQPSRTSEGARPFTYRFFYSAQHQLPAIASLAALSFPDVVLQADGTEPVQLNAVASSASLFDVLKVVPLIGRPFLPAEEVRTRGGSVALISEELWRSRFGSDPAILGRKLILNDRPFVLIGVMPAKIRLPPLAVPPAVWIPLGADPMLDQLDKMFASTWDRRVYLTLWARLKSKVDLEAAEASITAAATPLLARDDLGHSEDTDLRVRSVEKTVRAEYRGQLYILLSAALLTLIVSSANVSNLLVARALSRRPELSVRYALGERPSQLLARMLLDGAFIATTGALTGAVAARPLLLLLQSRVPLGLLPFREVGLSADVISVVVAGSVLAVLAAALIPAIRLTGFRNDRLTDSFSRLSEGRSATIHRRLLVVLETACAVVALACFVSLYRAYQTLSEVPLGFDPRSVLVAELTLPQTSDSGERWKRLADGLVRDLGHQQGVSAAAIAIALPTSRTMRPSYTVGGRPLSEPMGLAEYRPVSPNYFSALRIPIVRGRGFLESEGEPVCVVSQRLAAAAFPNGDAIGAVVEPLSAGACRITGVAADVASFNLRGSPPAVIYVPFRQMPNEAVQSSLVIVARTRSGLSPSELEYNRGALARIIREAAPTLPVKVTPFRSIIEDLTSADRFRATLMAAVSIAALFLAAAGAFGAAAAYVASRRRELTMRGILGATPARLVASVAMDGLRLAGLGLSIGWTAAYFTLSLWSSQLPDLPRTDAGALILISGVVGSLVLASTYLAGRRLTRLNLADMLRAQ